MADKRFAYLSEDDKGVALLILDQITARRICVDEIRGVWRYYDSREEHPIGVVMTSKESGGILGVFNPDDPLHRARIALYLSERERYVQKASEL